MENGEKMIISGRNIGVVSCGASLPIDEEVGVWQVSLWFQIDKKWPLTRKEGDFIIRRKFWYVAATF